MERNGFYGRGPRMVKTAGCGRKLSPPQEQSAIDQLPIGESLRLMQIYQRRRESAATASFDAGVQDHSMLDMLSRRRRSTSDLGMEAALHFFQER